MDVFEGVVTIGLVVIVPIVLSTGRKHKVRDYIIAAGAFIGIMAYAHHAEAAGPASSDGVSILAAAKVDGSMLFLTDQKCGKGAAVWKAYQAGKVVDHGCYTLNEKRSKIEPIGLPVGTWEGVDFETLDTQ